MDGMREEFISAKSFCLFSTCTMCCITVLGRRHYRHLSIMLILLIASILPVAPCNSDHEDIVVTIGTHHSRVHYALATRAWRKGICAFIVTDLPPAELPLEATRHAAVHNEVFLSYPDFINSPSGLQHDMPGDRRVAITPFLAYRYLKHRKMSFNWLLHGDDDTMYWMSGTHLLLSRLNPTVPLFMSDAVMCAGEPDCAGRLVCPACGFIDPSDGPTSCDGCTTSSICASQWNITNSNDCLAGNKHTVPYGGNGFIFSSGLFASLYRNNPPPPVETAAQDQGQGGGVGPAHSPQDVMEVCINTMKVVAYMYTGGDGILARCMWSFNMTITHPCGVKCGSRQGAPGSLFGDMMNTRDLAAWGSLLVPPHDKKTFGHRLTEQQVHRLVHAVSTHVWARSFWRDAGPLSFNQQTARNGAAYYSAVITALQATYEAAHVAVDRTAFLFTPEVHTSSHSSAGSTPSSAMAAMAQRVQIADSAGPSHLLIPGPSDGAHRKERGGKAALRCESGCVPLATLVTVCGLSLMTSALVMAGLWRRHARGLRRTAKPGSMSPHEMRA